MMMISMSMSCLVTGTLSTIWASNASATAWQGGLSEASGELSLMLNKG